MTIGQAARRAGVGIETIRYYERRGLLVETPKSASGYRDFDDAAVERILFIRRAKELGFTLTEIKELLNLRVDSDRNCDDVRIIAEEKMRDIGERIRSLHRIELALRRLVKLCAAEGAGGNCPLLAALEEGLLEEGL
jgi:MerR family copper efflux transcriptional regulator